MGRPDLLVQGQPPPSPSSPWTILPDEPSQAVALAFKDHILKELLEAFNAPEPRQHLVDGTSQFHIPQSIYPCFFKAPSPVQQVVCTSNMRAVLPTPQ